MNKIKKSKYTLNIALGIGKRFFGINFTLNYSSLGLHKHNYLHWKDNFVHYNIAQKKRADIQNVTNRQFLESRIIA